MNDLTVDAIRRLIEDSQPAPPDLSGGTTPFLVLRKDQEIHSLEAYLPRPERKTGTVVFTRRDSFLRYVNEHKLPETRIYADCQGFTAVIDHHSTDSAGWAEHRAKYIMVPSAEWKLWTGHNAKKMNQREFGILIEDNMDDISNPPSAEMLEMVRHFFATTTAEFGSYERDDAGSFTVNFTQTVQNKAGIKGDISLPTSFLLHIPPFEGGERTFITARLRFDVAGGKLVLWYDLMKPQKVVEATVQKITEDITAKTGIEPFYGNPA